MTLFWPEGFYTILMVGTFVFGAFFLKLPIAISMVLAAIAGSIVAGEGLPLRHLVEGIFGYLDTILIIATAMIFMKVIEKKIGNKGATIQDVVEKTDLSYPTAHRYLEYLAISGLASKEPKYQDGRSGRPRFIYYLLDSCTSPKHPFTRMSFRG